MENLTEEGVLDLSKSNTRLKLAEDQIVPATNKEDIATISSFKVTPSSAAGSSIDLSVSPFGTYEDFMASIASSSHNNSSFSSMELPSSSTTPELKETDCGMLQKGGESETMMSNMEFYSLLEPMQEKIQEACVRMQAFLGSKTEAELEEEVPDSLFNQFKTDMAPFLESFENALGIIPKVLGTTPEKFIEIGDDSKRFKISQASFEKAVSKSSIKDAAVALIECETFLPRSEKLEATVGRKSSCKTTGKKLKPLETAMLTALYKLIADKRKMVNIQRMEDCLTSSPDFLTLTEQKMVREALSQYFNQLRQRERRQEKVVSPSDDNNQGQGPSGNIN